MTAAKKAIATAAKTLSGAGGFSFTERQLYYELRRREAVPEMDEKAFAKIVAKAGKVPGLIVPRTYLDRLAHRSQEPDIFDYAVRRALVFERVELMLLFALAGFHRKLECALLARDGAPKHVWGAIERQLALKMTTRFYLVHDADAPGQRMGKELGKKLAKYKKYALVRDIGLDFSQALRSGLPVHTGKPASIAGLPPGQTRRLLQAGNYAHLEELPPLALLRWVYPRVAKHAAEIGFG